MSLSLYCFSFYIFLSYFQFLFASVLPLNLPHKLVSLGLLIFSVLVIKKKVISSGFALWLAIIIFLNIISFYFLAFDTELIGYGRTIMYLLYKLPEVALICIFVSSHDKNRLYVILPRVRNWFVISSFILFLYFVLVYFNILPYIHRFIAFNSDRFGGLVGEPRDFGLLSFVFLMSTFAFPDKNSIWQRGILAVFVVSSGSNAVVLLILALLWYYIFSMKPKATLVLSVFIFFSLYGVISTIDFKIGRFDLDASELVNIATSFNPNNPPPALNPITVRFFNFVFNLYWMSKGWFSYGIGSSMDIAYNQQLFDYNVYESSTGLFGFTTIGVELGLVGLAIVLISAFSFQVKVHHLGWLSLLSFSILIVILLLSSPYSAFYLFLLLYVYKIGLNEKVLKGRFQ